MKNRLLLTLGGLLLATTLAHAQLYLFDLNLDGGQEVPVRATPAIGTGTASLNWNTFNFTIDFSFSGLVAPTTASHVHKAPFGVNGPVVIPITNLPIGVTSGDVSFSATISEALAWDIRNGNSYLNIHTQTYPGGEIRGQLVPNGAVPEPSTYALAGAAALCAAVAVRRLRGRRRNP